MDTADPEKTSPISRILLFSTVLRLGGCHRVNSNHRCWGAEGRGDLFPGQSSNVGALRAPREAI